MERPIWDSTDSPLWAGTAPVTSARKLMPRYITASRIATTAIVDCALRHSGGLKAGTPLATASVPVMAEQPSAKARASSSTPKVSGRTTRGVTSVTCGGTPSSVRATPRPTRSSALPRNRYVGRAKIVPLSRTPRRLIVMTTRIEATITGTCTGARAGNAELIATMPAATLTDTVST